MLALMSTSGVRCNAVVATDETIRQQLMDVPPSRPGAPCCICAGTGRTPATSAPGLGSPLPHLRRNWAQQLPHLRRNWAQQLPHLSGTGLAPAGRARLPQWFEGPRARGDLMVFASGTVSGTARGREGLCTSDAQPLGVASGTVRALP